MGLEKFCKIWKVVNYFKMYRFPIACSPPPPPPEKPRSLCGGERKLRIYRFCPSADASNRPAERRKSFTSSNTMSSLSTPSYVRPFSSPPPGFANVLDRTKQKRKSQERTTPVALAARRTKPASVVHKARELTEREKELFRLGSRGLAALLDDDTIWES